MLVVVGLLMVITALGSTVQIIGRSGHRTAGRVAETILAWYLPLLVGIGGLFAFAGHAFVPAQVAASIGWPERAAERRGQEWPAPPSVLVRGRVGV